MKLQLLIVALLLSTVSMAQGVVKKGTMTQENTLREAIVLEMDVPTDEAKDLFDEFMDDRYDIKVGGLGFLGNKDEVAMEKVQIDVISKNSIDIYAEFKKARDGYTNMTITAREGYDLYFGPDHRPESFKALKNLMNDFRVFAQKAYITETIDESTDTLEDLNKDLEKAQKKIERNTKDIKDNLKDNKDMEQENADLAKESKELRSKIESMKMTVDGKKSKLESIKK